MDEMFQAATMIAAFLLCLDGLYSPCQAHHKLFGNPFYSTGTITPLIFITPSVLFLQMHQMHLMHSWHLWGGLVTLEFLQGEKTGGPWLWRIVNCLSPWAPGQFHGNLLSLLPQQPLGNQSKSLPVGPPSGRPPSLLVARGAHHKSSLSLFNLAT